MKNKCVRQKTGSCLGCEVLNNYDATIEKAVFNNGGEELTDAKVEKIRTKHEKDYCPTGEHLTPSSLNNWTLYRVRI